MTATPHFGTGDLTEDQRRAALGRFQTLRPHLEEDVPLARIAHEHKSNLRTPNRWATNYRQLELAWLCRKPPIDKDKRRMSPTLQQLIDGLAMRNLCPVLLTLDFFAPCANSWVMTKHEQ